MTTATSIASQVVFTAPLRAEVQERKLGELRPHEVLVRTRRSLISTGTELTVLRGGHTPGSHWARLFPYPWDAGYCNVGVVARMGAAVSRLRVGDRVTSTGPHASSFIFPEEDCVLVPEGVTDDEAVFATIAQIVMQGVRLAHLELGENAVICGLGLLGQMATALVRHVGSWPLMGVDLEPFRQQMALKVGATAVTNPAGAPEIIRRYSEDRMADVVFEVTGNPNAIPDALGWLRPLGRFVLVSSPSGPTTIDFHDLVNARGTVIIGAHNYTHPLAPNEYNRWTRPADTRLFLQLVEAGLLKMSELITHRFPAGRAPAAYTELLKNRASSLAVILEWDEG